MTPSRSSQAIGPGTCPECGAHIQSRHVLITYETDGRIKHYAECPGCLIVVGL
jgi:hypothetical protein